LDDQLYKQKTQLSVGKNLKRKMNDASLSLKKDCIDILCKCNIFIKEIENLKKFSNLYAFSNRKSRKTKLTKLDPTKLKKIIYASIFEI